MHIINNEGVNYTLLGVIDLKKIASSVDSGVAKHWMREGHPRKQMPSGYLSKDIGMNNGVSSSYAVFIATLEDNQGDNELCSLEALTAFRERNNAFISFNEDWQLLSDIDTH